MSVPSPLFQFDITVDDVTCLLKCKQFFIRADFTDIFSIYLKSPKQYNNSPVRKRIRKNISSFDSVCRKQDNKQLQDNIQCATQNVVVRSSIKDLQRNMKMHPMELTLLAKQTKTLQTASVQIPWKQKFLTFLDNVATKNVQREILDKSVHFFYHDVTSKRTGTIYLQIKLTYIDDAYKINKLGCFQNISDITNPDTYIGDVISLSDNYLQNPGVIKTTYYGKALERITKKKMKQNATCYNEQSRRNSLLFHDNDKTIQIVNSEDIKGSVASKSDTSISKELSLAKYYLNFHDDSDKLKNVYCVGYCTVGNDFTADSKGSPPKAPSEKEILSSSSKPSSPAKSVTISPQATSPAESEKNVSGKKFKLRICDSDCKDEDGPCSQSICSSDVPEEMRPQITNVKCKEVRCEGRIHRKPPVQVDSKILIDLHSLEHPCCKEEVVVGGMKANMTIGQDPCYCSCECTFGFSKKTTYCGVCGGYEAKGEDLSGVPIIAMPHACPIYHKLMDRSKSKSQILSTSGSGSKKTIKLDRQVGLSKDTEFDKKQTAKDPDKKKLADKKVKGESDKKSVDSDSKTGKKGKGSKDDRFKFNYGYQGIPPHIGHSKCVLPCQGAVINTTGRNVPKAMGWLWTAEDVPGLKFRANWKPGATNKHVVRLLKMAKNPGQIISKKKRRKESSKRKKNEKRPLLVVNKKEGEYTVTMETMKVYPKQRTLNQYPYEDKPLLTYTVGRTDEENLERTKKKARAQRRMERAQREFIQSSFKNMCQDICVKTYQQALGILPGTEEPDCACYPAVPDHETYELDRSCSCSEDSQDIFSETDSDEWVVEFTPPNAQFNSKFKPKKLIKVEHCSQYSYLDYRVKLLDRLGNPVPRFFKGPDGKEQCSDLGGFWDANKKWLEINIDGYIAPDGRWAPNTFIGPGGETVDAEMGKFQVQNGDWFVVGVDGYVDEEGKWRFYKRGRKSPLRTMGTGGSKRERGAGDRKGDKNKDAILTKPKSTTTWSCFGDNISPKYLSELGIYGHGRDNEFLKKSIKEMLARGEKITMPSSPLIPKSPLTKLGKRQHGLSTGKGSRSYFEDRKKCHHAIPSNKGIIAVDEEGNKTYFKLTHRNDKRPAERIHKLKERGISVSSFHVPCLHSFINTEIMKKQQRDRLFVLAAQHAATQVEAFLIPHCDTNVAQGWKPGAISKKLLRLLRKAKSSKLDENKPMVPTKKNKKRNVDKPLLTVTKKEGVYSIQMEVTNDDGPQDSQCSPLIYKVTKADNDEKIKRKDVIKNILIKKELQDWPNPYHPEVCNNVCLKAYNQAIGVASINSIYEVDEANKNRIQGTNSICGEIDIESDCSSLDVDWEIQFTPPFVKSKVVDK